VSRIERPDAPKGVTARAPLKQSDRGGSGSFLVLADDGARYWCKTLNNAQRDPRIPVNEQIVGRLGVTLGAAVCEPKLVYMGEPMVGWQFRDGHAIEEGWAHGSRAVEPVVETNELGSRAKDDNARRHVGIYALYDWVGGSDPQWLMVGADEEFHSHDHGHYFPGGPSWTIETLTQAGTTAFPIGTPAEGLDETEVARVADRLESITEQEVVAALSNLPAEWPTSDDQLEALVDFLLARREPAAGRVRALASSI
jgi:hypothetical protein